MFVFAFGVGAYVVLVLTTLYAIGFVGNWPVAFTIDGAPGHAAETGGWLASLACLVLFAAVHSGLGQPGFRRSLRAVVPPALERSLHVLVSCSFLMLAFLRWTPLPFVVWDLGVNPLAFVVEMLSYGGWTLALSTTVLLDHLELFGLRQALAHVRGEELPPPEFRETTLHRRVRHPLFLGLLIAVWCAPRMTLGHLVFAALVTAYVRFLARREEQALVLLHPEYRDYQARVPMLNPFRRPRVARQRGPPRSYRRAG